MHRKTISGLYAVTPDLDDTSRLLALVEAALQGGAGLLQYRNKRATAEKRHEQATALLPLCRTFGVPLIINDDVELCATIDADGVHLGVDDGSLVQARSKLGEGKVLGASCYQQLELAVLAKAQGADYVAFGSVFVSPTKPHAPRAPLELFAMAKRSVGLPTVAIGGITSENLGQVVNAGADSIATVTAVFSGVDVRAQTAELVELIGRCTN